MPVANMNDVRPNALEALHGLIEDHRPILEEAFAERGAIWLLPNPVRDAIAEILHAAAVCNGGVRQRKTPPHGREGVSRIG